MKEKGDLSRRKTHRIRTNIGMHSQAQSQTLGSVLKNIITGKE